MKKREIIKKGDLLLEVIPDGSTGTVTKIIFGENNFLLGLIVFLLGAFIWFGIFNSFEWSDILEDMIDFADEDGGLLFFGLLISACLLIFGYVNMALQNLWVFDVENKTFMYVKQNLLFMKNIQKKTLSDLEEISEECEKEYDGEDKKWEIDCRIHADFKDGTELESKKYTSELTCKAVSAQLKEYLKDYAG